MAEPKPRNIPCNDCDHLCESSDDGECFGRANKEERQAIMDSLAWMYLNNAQTVVANPEHSTFPEDNLEDAIERWR